MEVGKDVWDMRNARLEQQAKIQHHLLEIRKILPMMNYNAHDKAAKSKRRIRKPVKLRK